MLGSIGAEGEESRARHGRPNDAANGGGVPAALADPRMVGGGDGAHGLKTRGVRVEDVADAGPQLHTEHQRGGRGWGTQVGQARRVRVVVVEDVPGGAQGRNPLRDPVAERARRTGGGLFPTAHRAGEPIEEGPAVGAVDHPANVMRRPYGGSASPPSASATA